MISAEFLDTLRYGHLLAVAVGLGVAIMADVQMARSLSQPISRALIDQLKIYHKVIWAGLWGMWLTGLALVYVRTGFVVDAFTPKLICKLAVVAILTLNAMLMGRVALPLLEAAEGYAPRDLLLSHKIVGGWLGAISTTSWLTALALGSSALLKTSPWEVFSVLLPSVYLLTITGATLGVIALHALDVFMGQLRRLRTASTA